MFIILGKGIIPVSYFVNNWKYTAIIRKYPMSTFGSIIAFFEYYQVSYTLQNDDG